MNVSRKLTALGLAGAMALSLAGCGGAGSDDATAENASVYRELYSSEVTTLNYLITSKQVEYKVGANVVDCLVEYDNYGNIIPSLAESWEHNEDMTEWTFHIRQGVKWVDKDGKEVGSIVSKYAKKLEEEMLWELRDEVVVINSEGKKLETELLYWDMKKEIVYSDRYSRLTSGDQIIEGNGGFESDQQLYNPVFKNVTGQVEIPEQS